MPAFDKKQMDAMVNRFLGWKLPVTFSPDAGVSFRPTGYMMSREESHSKGWWPMGTNLLNADEARAMLEHVLDVTFIPEWSLLEATQGSLRENMAIGRKLRDALAELVACKDLKDRAEAIAFAGPLSEYGDGWKAEHDRMRAEYIRRQPLAWQAARAALADVCGVNPSDGSRP